MTTTVSTPTTSTPTRPTVWKHGVGAAVVASIAVLGVAATASAAGVSFAIDGVAISLLGFANITVICSLVGVALAAVIGRRARQPRTTFVRTTVALTILSCVPSLTSGFDTVSGLTLAALHVVAAAIVIPVLAGRLAEAR